MLRGTLRLCQRAKCAVFGGAFDPPTHGHLACVQMLLDSDLADEVLVVPCGSRPDKVNLGDKLSRYVMTELAVNTHFEDNMNVKLCDWEYHAEGGIATYDLLQRLSKADPSKDYSFVVGSDWLTNAAGIPTWESDGGVTGPLLLSKYDFLVVPRPGYDVASAALSGYGPRFKWVTQDSASTVDISSTEIRQYVKDGAIERAKHHLPAAVYSYVRRMNLYHA